MEPPIVIEIPLIGDFSLEVESREEDEAGNYQEVTRLVRGDKHLELSGSTVWDWFRPTSAEMVMLDSLKLPREAMEEFRALRCLHRRPNPWITQPRTRNNRRPTALPQEQELWDAFMTECCLELDD